MAGGLSARCRLRTCRRLSRWISSTPSPMQSRFLAVAAALTAIGATFPSGAFDPNVYLAHIRYLASPELQGRGDGSPGLEMAAQYIERQLRADGLTTHEQPFQLTTDARL